jgi:hypothetical protein
VCMSMGREVERVSKGGRVCVCGERERDCRGMGTKRKGIWSRWLGLGFYGTARLTIEVEPFLVEVITCYQRLGTVVENRKSSSND